MLSADNLDTLIWVENLYCMNNPGCLHTTCVVGAVARMGGSFGVGTGAIVYDDINCIGTEARLSDCQSISTHNCNHGEDAGVVCQQPSTAGI